MGGAPPPPLDVAPQGPKNRKNSTLLGSDFGGMQGPRIIVQTGGGEGGIPTTTPHPGTWSRGTPLDLDPGMSRKGEDIRA